MSVTVGKQKENILRAQMINNPGLVPRNSPGTSQGPGMNTDPRFRNTFSLPSWGLPPTPTSYWNVVAMLVSAVAICCTSAGPQMASSPPNQVTDAAITPAPVTAVTGVPLLISNPTPAVTRSSLPISNPTIAVTGAPLPISNPTPPITGAPLPISNPTPAVTGASLPISNPTTAVTGAPLPISNPTPAVTGVPLPISSPTPTVTGAPLPISNPTPAVTEAPLPTVTGVPLSISSPSQAVTGAPLPISNTEQAILGVPLFFIDSAIPSNIPTTVPGTLPSTVHSLISDSNVQPTNHFTVTLANSTTNANLSGTSSHIAPMSNPADDPNLRLLADLLGNLNINPNINVHHEHLSNVNVNPNLDLMAEFLSNPALGEYNPVEGDPRFDFFAELFVDSTSDPHSGPIIDQVALNSANPQMKLLANLLGNPSPNLTPNIASNLQSDSFHNPYANPVTDLASKSGANTENHPAPNLFNKHLGIPLINFIKNPLGSLFDKHKDKVQSKSPLARLFTKHAEKMESLGNLFQSFLPPKGETNSDLHSPQPDLDDIARLRRRVLTSKIVERIQSLRQTGDSNTEKRKQFFGDCSSSSMPSCSRSTPRSKRGFRRLKPVLNFMRSVLRVFGIDIPDKLFNLVSGIVTGPSQNNATTSSQSSTENVVKSDVQYLIC